VTQIAKKCDLHTDGHAVTTYHSALSTQDYLVQSHVNDKSKLAMSWVHVTHGKSERE
jgi:hypothetical protein